MPPSFDLVLATVGRVEELRRFLDSLAQQTYRRFRVLLVDQNEDARLEPVVAASEDLDLVHLRSAPGLSQARNRALAEVRADIVGFPDDDCVYASVLLERVAGRFEREPGLDGLTGRAVGPTGLSSSSWKLDKATLTETNLWNRAISYTIFLRRELVERVGPFDEALGLGSGNPWSSGEEIEYLVRALRAGAAIEYDPSLAVTHAEAAVSRAVAYRDGASLGYILRTHAYPKREVGRRFLRPLGGALLALARSDVDGARVHAATLRGRIRGYLSA